MEFINGITFAPFPHRGRLGSDEAKRSLELLASRTGASHIILAPAGLQETAHSFDIDFSGERTPGDAELSGIIRHAHNIGLKVILKPTVNCNDGTWRAFIDFSNDDDPEAQWSRWFTSHERFQLYYAGLAESSSCEMFILGCEMISAEGREREWRDLVTKTRKVYHGPVSYNTDKYHEDVISWWDCVDVISSSGYYPSGVWETELDRIEGVVRHFNKPFFFAETGCMSVKGSSAAPYDWMLAAPGTPDVEEQAAWYSEMFEHTGRRPWVEGYGLWSWADILPYTEENAAAHKGYDIYAQPAEKIVWKYFSKGKVI